MVGNLLYLYCLFDDLAYDLAESAKGLDSFLQTSLDHLFLGFIQLIVELFKRQLNYPLFINCQSRFNLEELPSFFLNCLDKIGLLG